MLFRLFYTSAVTLSTIMPHITKRVMKKLLFSKSDQFPKITAFDLTLQIKY